MDIPPESLSTPQRLQLEGTDPGVPLASNLIIVDLDLPQPSLQDLRADSKRILDACNERGHPHVFIALPVLQDSSQILRENGWSTRAVLRKNEVIALLPPGSAIYGLAADIGTTKVALYLVNLLTGEVVEKTGEMNPQIAYGEDVISRITFVIQHQDGRQILQKVLVDALNEKVGSLCRSAGIRPEQIVDAVIVGNTAMHHLLSGLAVEQLAYAPYVPAVNDPMDIHVSQLGVELAPCAYLHLLPNIAGYVGADHSAVILSTELWKNDNPVLVIDIGTNTEISLASGGRLLSCSCASGPAFEGAHISHGMRAAPGAIERVQIQENGIQVSTIGERAPVGICGSGILDVVAEMKANGLVNENGQLKRGHPNIRENQVGRLELLLVPASSTGHNADIVVSRGDINEIQLAKAAIRAGQEILLSEAGMKSDDIEEIIIAGAFGTYINVANAVSMGMFPALPVSRFRQVGNAAGMGAMRALVSHQQRELICDVIERVEYIELTTKENFQDEFIAAMYLR